MKRRHFAIVLIQVVLIVFSVSFAWLLRFDFSFPERGVFLRALPWLVLIRLLVLARFNLFHGYWRYTGINDALDVIKAVSLGSAFFLILERWVLGVRAFPISIYIVEAILTGAALCGVRIASRAFLQGLQQYTLKNSTRTVVVVGAGRAAAVLLRELPATGYTAVALVDDDHGKLGSSLNGVRVVGKVSDLVKVVANCKPDEIMIAVPSATGEQMRRITDYCQKTELRFRTIPGLTDLIEGVGTIEQMREVKLEDLLGRDPVHLDLEAVRHSITGRVVMVTGAAGSIGSELCRQLLQYRPEKLVCVDQAETPLFHLQNALVGSQLSKAFCVVDITDNERMREVIQEHDVRVIFHTAAYKHVPLMEENLREAVKNNVFGLLSLLEVAEDCGCEDFLNVSTDKAVSPTSFMGCTKRIGELILASRPSSQMRCLSVRFGNVLGSQGSVIPLFQEQIRSRREVTVTHPEITRYFMTIPEAVSLLLQAFAVGTNGDILVLDMGQPVRILDMARTLIHLSGIPEDKVKIRFSGLRPGEKLFEELFYDFEERLTTPGQKVFATQSQIMRWPELLDHLDELRMSCRDGAPSAIRIKVKEIVPQYQWDRLESSLAAGDDRNIQTQMATLS